ncbi:DUF3244 domain-containing protein [Myceligenerans crystallogenes]|uniref:LPXTG-motif cell wall anchor domain-containing protein n=1 Tax=Myceligenerans crystallogenes TaxID=316335 RepID=A0ABN2NCH4_9MICO
MLRRIIAAAFALAALIMPVGATSAVADQYGPDEFPCTIELQDGVVTEGETVHVEVWCAIASTGTIVVTDEDGDVVDSEEVTVGAGETVMFTITDLPPGDYTISFCDADGEELAESASLTVLPAAVPGDDGDDDPVVPDDDGDLAATGPTSLPYLATAGALLLAGIAALVVTRRARSQA